MAECIKIYMCIVIKAEPPKPSETYTAPNNWIKLMKLEIKHGKLMKAAQTWQKINAAKNKVTDRCSNTGETATSDATQQHRCNSIEWIIKQQAINSFRCSTKWQMQHQVADARAANATASASINRCSGISNLTNQPTNQPKQPYYNLQPLRQPVMDCFLDSRNFVVYIRQQLGSKVAIHQTQ